jgi:aryl-alcohol dehydrogenase-like predicted oxidoreductase
MNGNGKGMALTRRALCAGVGLAGASPALAASGSMLTRPIPHSGEPLPVIGLGTANVFDIDDDKNERAARAGVIQALLAAGGSLIDTAPSYGTADAVVGDIVAAMNQRAAVFLATKLETFEPAAARTEFRDSLRRLRMDKVDLLQFHNVDDPHLDLGLLRDLKAQGTCRYVGITTTFHGDFAAAEAILRRENPDFLEIDYSIEDREAEKRLIPAARDAGTAILTAVPFGRGRLFRTVRQRPLPPWAADFGAATWGQFFIKFLLAEPAITAVIPGTGNPEHMQDNLAAGRGRVPDAAERRKMIAYFASLG